ncbi:uncharacterized protein LOC134839790 [Symsagittifera roscoffensis]|uniref:uncharacterized protein LOC134839790 n=1 Tax=Symsagittifera roscoffensis TaxID=84072 RepID=UPI00307C8DF7
MPTYEALFAFKASGRLLGGVAIHDVIKKSVLSMMKEGAIVTHLKNMGEMRLGEKRYKERRGHFFLVQCEMPSQKVDDMALKLIRDEDILHLVTSELTDVELPRKNCSGSVSHLVLNPELHDYDWNFEGNLMKQVPREFQRMNPQQTKSSLKGAGINEIWGRGQ